MGRGGGGGGGGTGQRDCHPKKYYLLSWPRTNFVVPFSDIFNNPFTHKQLGDDIRFSVFPGVARQRFKAAGDISIVSESCSTTKAML